MLERFFDAIIDVCVKLSVVETKYKKKKAIQKAKNEKKMADEEKLRQFEEKANKVVNDFVDTHLTTEKLGKRARKMGPLYIFRLLVIIALMAMAGLSG